MSESLVTKIIGSTEYHRKRSIRMRILLTMAIALILATLASSLITFRSERAHLLKHHLDYQENFSKLVSTAVMMAMMQKSPQSIQEALEQLQENSSILDLQIISKDGMIKYSTVIADTGEIHDEIILLDWSPDQNMLTLPTYRQGDKSVYTMVSKITNPPQCHQCHVSTNDINGFLTIKSDVAWIERDILGDTSRNIFTVIGTIFFLAVAILFIHLRYVQGNLKKITESIAEVETGNFESHINLETNDEMGKLASSFNGMIDRLNQMRDHLKDVHKLQLERADKLANVGELAAGMAHEIKNPVAGISSALKVILKDENCDEKRKPFFEEMLRQILRVDRAVNSLLTYAKPPKLRIIPSDLSEIVKKALSFVKQQAALSSVRIVYEDQVSTPPLKIDPEQIEQVLVNIFLNAIQAMPNGGELIVDSRFDPEESNVYLTVEDTGMGINPENFDKIFKPFFTRKHRGTGLGLAISNGIIKRHGGTIEVVRTSEKGTTFQILIPVNEYPSMMKPVLN